MKLPTDYTRLNWEERKQAREQYIKEQNHLCMYCNSYIFKDPPSDILDKKINWKLFPKNFLKYSVHLQHNHKTGMTEGAVHAYCNAVLWQYEKR